MYSQRDVDTIRWLKARVDEGLSISRASELLRTQSAAQPPTPIGGSPAAERSGDEAEGARVLRGIRNDMLQHLERMDEARAGQLLGEALALFSVEQVLEQVIHPLLVSVGEHWMRGEWTVAQEHFASAFIRGRIANMFHSSPFHSEGTPVLVACAPHELHEIGALVISLFLRRAGYKVIYLGQNVPLDSLMSMVHSLRPKAVCISATRTETGANLIDLQQRVAKLRSETGYAPVIAFGGALFDRNEGLSEKLGGHYLGRSAGGVAARLSQIAV